MHRSLRCCSLAIVIVAVLLALLRVESGDRIHVDPDLPRLEIISSSKQLYLPHVSFRYKNESYGFYSRFRNPLSFVLGGMIPLQGNLVSPDPIARDTNAVVICSYSWTNADDLAIKDYLTHKPPRYQMLFSNCYHWARQLLRQSSLEQEHPQLIPWDQNIKCQLMYWLL